MPTYPNKYFINNVPTYPNEYFIITIEIENYKFSNYWFSFVVLNIGIERGEMKGGNWNSSLSWYQFVYCVSNSLILLKGEEYFKTRIILSLDLWFSVCLYTTFNGAVNSFWTWFSWTCSCNSFKPCKNFYTIYESSIY